MTTSSPVSHSTLLAALPADIVNWNNEDSDKILKNSAIKIRLRKLLGKENYAAFMESFETLTPIEKSGDFLFSSGCLIHACGHLESAIAIDLVTKTIHAAIYNEEKKIRYFNESKSKTPEAITTWASHLSDYRTELKTKSGKRKKPGKFRLFKRFNLSIKAG